MAVAADACPPDRDLESFLTGTLRPDNEGVVLAHVDSCERCAGRLGEIDGRISDPIVRHLREAACPLPVEEARVKSGIDRLEGIAAAPPPIRSSAERSVLPGAVGRGRGVGRVAVLAVVVVAGAAILLAAFAGDGRDRDEDGRPADRATLPTPIAPGALDARLREVAAFAHESDDPVAVFSRWEAFREEAVGTEVGDYAARRAADAREKAERIARRELDRLRHVVLVDARSGEPDRGLERIEAYRARFGRTEAAGEVAALREDLERTRRGFERRTFSITGSFAKEPFVLSEGAEIDLAEGVVHDPDMAEGILRFTQVNRSFLRVRFQLESTPERAYLVIFHLMAYSQAAKMGYAPITIEINGRVVVGNWSPLQPFDHWSRWDVADYLVAGENTISWRLDDARTQYMLRSFEISDWEVVRLTEELGSPR